MNEKRNIDKLLRKELGDYSSGLPAGDWQVMQQKIAVANRKKKDRMYLPFILFGALACFLWQQPYVDMRSLHVNAEQEHTPAVAQKEPVSEISVNNTPATVIEKEPVEKSYKQFSSFSTPQEAIHTAVSSEQDETNLTSPNPLSSSAFDFLPVETISPFNVMSPRKTDSVQHKPALAPKAIKQAKSSLEFAVYYATGSPSTVIHDPKLQSVFTTGFDPPRVSRGLRNANVVGLQVNWHKRISDHWLLYTGLGYSKVKYEGRYVRSWNDPDLAPSSAKALTIVTTDMPQWSRISIPVGVAWLPLKQNELSIFANFTTHYAFDLSGQFPDYQFHAPEEQKKGFQTRQYALGSGVNIPLYRSRIGSLNLAYTYERMLGDFYQSTYLVRRAPLVTIRQHLHVVRLSWNLPLH